MTPFRGLPRNELTALRHGRPPASRDREGGLRNGDWSLWVASVERCRVATGCTHAAAGATAHCRLEGSGFVFWTRYQGEKRIMGRVAAQFAALFFMSRVQRTHTPRSSAEGGESKRIPIFHRAEITCRSPYNTRIYDTKPLIFNMQW